MSRRKALVIMGFKTQDAPLNRVHQGWNKWVKDTGANHALITPTTSMDFLIAKEKDHKGPGFPEIELKQGETVMQALQRHNPMSASAITKPWQQIISFPYKDWEVLVGVVEVHPNQRQVDLYDQSDELPYLLEWVTPRWFFLQNEPRQFNYITRLALSKKEVQDFLFSTQQAKAA